MSSRTVRRAAKDTALVRLDLDSRDVADLKRLPRMGLHPQRLPGGQRGVILADIAEENVIGDFGGVARRGTCGRPQADILRPDRDVHGIAWRQSVERGDIKR